MNEEFDNWEEVPEEDLYEDGEKNKVEAMMKVWWLIGKGTYKLIRRKHDR